MNNKDRLALKRITEELERFNKFDKSREGKKLADTLGAIEDAAGGKEKLDKADELFRKAEKAYRQRVSDGEKAAKKIVDAAVNETKLATERFAEKMVLLDKERLKAERDQISVNKRATELGEWEMKLQSRQLDIEKLEETLEERFSKVASREQAVEAKEAEIRRFEEWRKTAPA